MRKLLWLSDLHLDRVDATHRDGFYHRLANAPGEEVVISGDISDGRNLTRHLSELGEACGKRTVYFVLGNHDFYGSSFRRVHSEVDFLCTRQNNLRHLGQGEIIPLGDNEALVGHGGWADGRAGKGPSSRARNPDFYAIEDFHGKSRADCFRRMRSLGEASADYFRGLLPYALSCYRHLWVLTHVPPFTQGAHYNGKPCSYDFQPHYTNVSLGFSLWGMSERFPASTITVLAGHTHTKVTHSLRQNLHILTASASPGNPRYEGILEGMGTG